MGRRKITPARIEDPHRRQICFSKRRRGLFSKGAELCRRGGGELTVVIFSPAGHIYCCGWPSVDSVVWRHFRRSFALPAAVDGGDEEADKRGGFELRRPQRHRGGREGDWWEVSPDGLERHELELLHAMLVELQEKASERAAAGLLRGEEPAAAASGDRQCSRHRRCSCSAQAKDASCLDSQLCPDLSPKTAV